MSSILAPLSALARIAALAVPLACFSGAAQASLITNGSFESHSGSGSVISNPQLPGWGINGLIEVVTTGLWQVADGVASLDLNGIANGGVWQKFATEVGATYKVNFMLAGNPSGPSQMSLRVSAADVIKDYLLSVAGKSFSNMGWTEKEFQFTAQAATTTLTFQSLVPSGAMGPTLDNVRVELVSAAANVPEPAAAALIGGALLGLAGLRRKRRAA